MGSNTRLRRRLWWCVAAAALAIGVVAFLGTLPKSDPAMLVLSHATSTPKLVPSAKTLSITRSRPVTLTIPVLGIRTVVGTLGLQPDQAFPARELERAHRSSGRHESKRRNRM